MEMSIAKTRAATGASTTMVTGIQWTTHRYSKRPLRQEIRLHSSESRPGKIFLSATMVNPSAIRILARALKVNLWEIPVLDRAANRARMFLRARCRVLTVRRCRVSEDPRKRSATHQVAVEGEACVAEGDSAAAEDEDEMHCLDWHIETGNIG